MPFNPLMVVQNAVLRIRIPDPDPEGSIESVSATLVHSKLGNIGKYFRLQEHFFHRYNIINFGHQQ